MTKAQTKMRLYRYSITAMLVIITALVFGGVIKTILPGFMEILESGSGHEIEAYIAGFGTTKGVLLAFLMQFIQIVSIVLPGGPIQIAVGIIFGTVTGFIICHLGYIAANVFVFGISRKLGNKIDEVFPYEEENSKENFITASNHPGIMVFLACLVPFMPNGIIPHIAAKTKMSFLDFLLAIYLGSAPCMLLLCAVGGNLVEGDYVMAGVYGVILFGGVILLYIKRDKVVELSEKLRRRF